MVGDVYSPKVVGIFGVHLGHRKDVTFCFGIELPWSEAIWQMWV